MLDKTRCAGPDIFRITCTSSLLNSKFDVLGWFCLYNNHALCMEISKIQVNIDQFHFFSTYSNPIDSNTFIHEICSTRIMVIFFLSVLENVFTSLTENTPKLLEATVTMELSVRVFSNTCSIIVLQLFFVSQKTWFRKAILSYGTIFFVTRISK